MPRAFLHVELDPAGDAPGPRPAQELALKGLLSELTDRVETLGTGRITADLPRLPSLGRTARELEGRIRQSMRVAPRIGVAPNAPLARLASRAVRPSGTLVIEDAGSDVRVTELPVDAIHGVGPVSSRLLEAVGVATVGDLLSLAPEVVLRVLGPVGGARVLRAVSGRDPGFPRRSRSSERTFPAAVRSAAALEQEVERQLAGLLVDLARDGLAPRSLTVRLRGGTGEVVSRVRTLAEPCGDRDRLTAMARALLHDRTGVGGVEVRTLGVSVTGFGPPGTQLALPFE